MANRMKLKEKIFQPSTLSSEDWMHIIRHPRALGFKSTPSKKRKGFRLTGHFNAAEANKARKVLKIEQYTKRSKKNDN